MFPCFSLFFKGDQFSKNFIPTNSLNHCTLPLSLNNLDTHLLNSIVGAFQINVKDIATLNQSNE